MSEKDEFSDAWDEMNNAAPATGKVDDRGTVTIETAADAALVDDGRQVNTLDRQNDTPAAAEAEAEVETKDKDAEAAAPAEDDLWAGLSEAQKLVLENLQKTNQDLSHRASSDAARVAVLQRQMDQLQQRLAAAPAAAPAAAADEDPEMVKFRQEYPDIAGPVLKLVGSARQALAKEVDSRLQPLAKRQSDNDAERDQQFIASQMDKVEERHQGWRQIVASDDFGQWLATQPPGVRAMGGSVVAEDAIHVLDLFTSATSQVADITKRRTSRLAQAVSVQGNRVAAQPGRAAILDDFDAAWDAFDAQDQQKAGAVR